MHACRSTLEDPTFEIFKPLAEWVRNRDIRMSTEFYLFFTLIGLFLAIGMVVQVQFDYWELTPNELIHRQGLLGDEARLSTAGMKFSKDITDIFEYMCFGSGRLDISLPAAGKNVTLETVVRLNKVMKEADIILRRGRAVVETDRIVAAELGPTAVRTSDT